MYGQSVSPAGKFDAAAELATRIKLDKQHNPAKYAVLAKKGLTDKEIYRSKVDYEESRVDNRKSLGNHYLSLSKKKLKT